jgi:CheY-like chemotaxis protein
MFKNLGYEITLAVNGVEAVDFTLQNNYDIVFMDMMMPEMSGGTVIQILRKINPQVKVITTSGLGSTYHSVGATSGITAFLAKPFTTIELLETLHQHLSKQ